MTPVPTPRLSLATLPSVNFHALIGGSAFLLFVVTCCVCLACGRALDTATLVTVGGIVLGYNGKASYDFRTKRKTEIVTPPAVMATDAAAVSTVPPAGIP